MRTMTAEQAATEIRRAYGLGRTRQWMRITTLTHRTDLTITEIHQGLRHLLDTDPTFEVAGETNQKTLTVEDRNNRFPFAGDLNDLIAWM